MCDQRERLIEFLYEEADAPSRREFAGHLESCGACRDEVSAFGRVRTDLLAWDVPEHESVWKPFAPAGGRAWWRVVPAWAMAAAAAIVFAIGAAGGVATRSLVDRAAPAPAETAAVAPARPTVTPASVSRQDLDTLRQDLVSTMRTEMDARVRLVSTHAPSVAATSDRDLEQVRSFVRTSNQRDDEILSFVRSLNNDVINIKANQDTRIDQLRQRVEQLSAALAAMAQQQAGGKQ